MYSSKSITLYLTLVSCLTEDNFVKIRKTNSMINLDYYDKDLLTAWSGKKQTFDTSTVKNSFNNRVSVWICPPGTVKWYTTCV